MSVLTYEIRDNRLPELIERGRDALEEVVKKTAVELQRNVAIEAPVDEGKLAGSWLIRGGGLEYWVYTNTEYAQMVAEGTRPHVIVPVSASVLVFEKNGRTIFAKRVNHPGTAANDYPGRAMERTRDRVDEFVKSAMKRVFD